MLSELHFIRPNQDFWRGAAQRLLRWQRQHSAGANDQNGGPNSFNDLSSLRVLVPNFGMIPKLRAALVQECGPNFLPPRMTTLAAWCNLKSASVDGRGQTDARRMMDLYAELRQHAWLKKLFSAKRNTDLMPLAQVLLSLSDELTRQLLPEFLLDPHLIEQRWNAMLEVLTPTAQRVLSNESQLVWSIWKNQLDHHDPLVEQYQAMLRIAESADEHLVWIAPHAPEPMEAEFLRRYRERTPVLTMLADWTVSDQDRVLASAWGEMLEPSNVPMSEAAPLQIANLPQRLYECRATSLEDEALKAAQTIVDWLVAGKTDIAVVVQDRVSARRLRALLERADVHVADETGWKLSTTRAASVIAAWFEVIAGQAGMVALMDLLKSPFMLKGLARRDDMLIAIETSLLASNVASGWDAAVRALEHVPDAQQLIRTLASHAKQYAGRRSLREWTMFTRANLHELGIWQSLHSDVAGRQICDLLDHIAFDCRDAMNEFSFSEWRAFLNLQLEATSYVAALVDQRVRMLTLGGARLSSFDAVLVLGCDAEHLPASDTETLFFGNTVRAELGLRTREQSQRMQLRDLCGLLWANEELIFSWQAFRNGEHGTPSPWLERLSLSLAHAGLPSLALHDIALPEQLLRQQALSQPQPSAPGLLPTRLSASAYNSFVACPYQYFASRMLRLSEMDELSDGPEKRDYGDWLHEILKTYHETLRDQPVPLSERETLLRTVSEQVFQAHIGANTAALGYRVRWSKVVPAYLDWANAREAQGWRFASAEKEFERKLELRDTSITLFGRVDRMDVNEQGEFAVLDYKTRKSSALKEKIRSGEDHQLAFYGLLADQVEHPVTDGALVALEIDKEKTGAEEAPEYRQWQQRLQHAIVDHMDAVAAGAPLPANGVESVCQYCRLRGLCRKGSW